MLSSFSRLEQEDEGTMSDSIFSLIRAADGDGGRRTGLGKDVVSGATSRTKEKKARGAGSWRLQRRGTVEA